MRLTIFASALLIAMAINTEPLNNPHGLMFICCTSLAAFAMDHQERLDKLK